MHPIHLALLLSKMLISPNKLTAVDKFDLLTGGVMPSVTDRLLIMYGILPRQLFFVVAVVYSGSWNFLYGRCKQLFVSELSNAYFFRHLF